MSGADLASLCQRAALNAIRQVIDREGASARRSGKPAKGALQIDMHTFGEALAEVKHGVASRSSKNGTVSADKAPASSGPHARPI